MNKILLGDALTMLKTLPDESVDCIITSPPYWGLRDYGVAGQTGLEPTLKEFIENMLAITAECKRVLKKEGTMFWNHGDSYGGSGKGGMGKNSAKKGTEIKYPKLTTEGDKSLALQAYRLVVRMIDDQKWILRNTIIWHKKNAMPSSVLDRFNNKYEPVFFFSKNKNYYFDLDSVRVPFETNEKREAGIVRERVFEYNVKGKGFKHNTKEGTKNRDIEEQARALGKRRPPQAGGDYIRNPKGKNPGDVWTLTLQPHKDRHVAMFPEKLIAPMILAGSPRGGVVLDPFFGSGTTGVVAHKLGRQYIGIELNPQYAAIAEERLGSTTSPLL